MPPRGVVVAIVLAWLATAVWFVAEHWLPWWRTSEHPPFAIELADEVVPVTASWSIIRKEKRIGAGETRMAPRPDGTFEMTTRLRDLDLPAGLVTAKLPLLLTTSHVNRAGELQALDAKCHMLFKMLGNELKVDATITGRVEGDLFVGTTTVDCSFGVFTEPLQPIPLKSKSAFSPLQPMQKYPALRPGQTWIVSSVDPASEALAAAIRQVGNRMLAEAFPNGKAPFTLPNSKPKSEDLLAEVQRDTETVTYKDRSYECRVVVFKGTDVKARVWVDVTDGKVIRQEAVGMGDTIILQRE